MTATVSEALASALSFLALQVKEVAIVLAALVGLYLVGIAFGWNFDISKALIKLKIGRRVRHIGLSTGMVLGGIAYLLGFGPRLFTDPSEAWQGVLMGSGLVIGGVMYLRVLGRWRLDRLAFGATAGTALAVVAVAVLGPLLGGAA
jgi:hypothetical protein